LTITADDKTSRQGEANPEFTLSYAGFKNADDETVLDELPSVSCLADENSPAGFYDILLSGGSDNNYAYGLVNGVLEITGTVGVVETSVLASVRVYPNPVKYDLHIQSEYPVERVEIIDWSGRIVVLRDTDAIQTVDVSALPAGMYFVRIYTGNTCVTEKVMVENP
ncbi:MAG: T9SS type A sorting domain-containing protein, partial [Dysgonamonadaceae bacterium]|nr:T9SS type A sorting domain-containing protein [Dysgonamonadaceae bacterium]